MLSFNSPPPSSFKDVHNKSKPLNIPTPYGIIPKRSKKKHNVSTQTAVDEFNLTGEIKLFLKQNSYLSKNAHVIIHYQHLTRVSLLLLQHRHHFLFLYSTIFLTNNQNKEKNQLDLCPVVQ